MNDILRLIRPKQWIKNLFVFLPVFFGGAMLNHTAMIHTFIAFVSFCLAASSVYCLNDIVDAEEDRRHPVKCSRPIASGAITERQAVVMEVVLALLSLAILFLLPTPKRLQLLTLTGIYLVLNGAYCARLKNFAIIDVLIVATGFVLRVLAGGFSGEVEPSQWLVLMTFLLTLFLSFAKRRDDVLRMEQTGIAPRKNTIRYNLTFVNQAITITASVTLVCYIMYTVSPDVTSRFDTDKLYLTSVFVLAGLLRYIQIAVVDKQSGDPTKVILRDRLTQLIVAAWLLTFLFIIY